MRARVVVLVLCAAVVGDGHAQGFRPGQRIFGGRGGRPGPLGGSGFFRPPPGGQPGGFQGNFGGQPGGPPPGGQPGGPPPGGQPGGPPNGYGPPPGGFGPPQPGGYAPNGIGGNGGYRPPPPNGQRPPPPDNGYQPRPPVDRFPPPEPERREYRPFPDPPREPRAEEVYPGHGPDPYRASVRPPPVNEPPPERPPVRPPSVAATPAAPPPGTPERSPENAGGLPPWLVPVLLLAAVPGVLFVGRKPAEPPRPLDAEALLSPATLRMDAGDFAGAIPYLQEVVRAHPVAADRGRLLLAQCFLKTGLPEVALEEVRNLNLNDQPHERLYGVAQTFEACGDPATARQLYLAILRTDVNFRDVANRVRTSSGATPILRPAALSGGVSQGPQGALPERFRDVKFLAQGGMGIVYSARDAELDRQVAIKMLAPAYCADAEFVERFFRESRAMARLQHPNIVAVHDVARGRVPYIVMELLEGRSLRRALADRELTPGQRIEVGLGVARALAYAHACGVLHRDVKPENIMVTRENRAKLLDFGLARLMQAEGDASRLTLPHVVMGTPSYMAPELNAGAGANVLTDGYALGKVLRELVAAPAPVTNPDGGAPLTPLAVSPALAAQIERLCAVNPTERPESLQAVIAQLEAELQRQSKPPAAIDLQAFRELHRALDDAYTRTLHGLKAALGVYRRCDGNPDKVFRYLLNPEGVQDISTRIEALTAGPVVALGRRKPAGVKDLDGLASELIGRDWRALATEVGALANATDRAAAVQRLKTIHEGVADLAGRMATALDAHRVRLAPVVEAAVRGVAGHERVKVDVQGEPALAVPAPERLAADVREVVENLVNNALEAQAQKVTVLLAPQAAGVELAVSDDGVGIPADRLPDLFEAGRTTKTTGSGTGLARVKQLCGQYGGKAHASSHTGAGTTFTLTFPA